jgi:(2Fe-2S) ferredoxin
MMGSLVPHRDRYLFVCINRRPEGNPKGSCAEKGSELVVQKLKEELAKRGLHKTIRACSSSCLDLCETGISVVQEPEHVAYGRVTLADVDELIDAASRGEVVERLLIHGAPPRKA